MKMLFDINILNMCKSLDLLPLKCKFCLRTFFIYAKFIKSIVKHKNEMHKYNFCSQYCAHEAIKTYIKCGECGEIVQKQTKEIRKSKSGKNFCSMSCSASYNNKHKITGTRRSKLEIWIQNQLTITYPNLSIEYNCKNCINSELDIHIPSLNLAIELNGIFHYKPIYGLEKLKSIQNNDCRKFQACLENNIEFVIIDVSKLIHFKEKKAIKYLNIITTIIDQKCYLPDLNRDALTGKGF